MMRQFFRKIRHRLIPEPFLDSPVILLGKGGGGSRLLSQMALDCGLAMGDHLNRSLDSLGMADAVYRSVERRLGDRADCSSSLIWADLRTSGMRLLHSIRPDDRQCWGFKLPECLFVLNDLRSVFPRARYAVILRDPFSTSTRRSHQTARMESHIGRITLPAAYRHCGLDPATISEDPIAVHNACATAHQLDLLLDHIELLEKHGEPAFVTRFEEIVRDPHGEISAFSNWLGRPVVASRFVESVNSSRASQSIPSPEDDLDRVGQIIDPVSRRIGRLLRSSESRRLPRR